MKLRVTVMPKQGVLDPEGKAIQQALAHMGLDAVREVRAGKVMLLDVAADDPAAACALGEEAARRLLANTVIESFTVEVL